MVTFIELRDSQPARLGEASDAWTKLGSDMTRLEDQVVERLTKPLRNSGWSGGGADAAFRICDKLDDEFELAARQVKNAAAVISYARREFVKVQEELRAVLAAAQREGMSVDERGTVSPPRMSGAAFTDPAANRAYQQLVANARTYTQQIASVVYKASQLDGNCARVLAQFAPHTPGQMTEAEWRDATRDARAALSLLGLSERDIPRAGTAPADARAWWLGLSDEQRSLYLAAHPERIGALDGLPAADRHEGSTMALRNLIDELRHPMPSETNPGSVGRLTGLLDRLEASEYGPDAQRLYLLGIDNRGDGQAIVSVGNPDTARHVGVVVPGMTVTLDHMGGQIDRAADLRQTADDLTANVTGDVAVVAWLGYDTPDGIFGAMGGRSAEAGAPALDRFIDGMHVSQDVEGERRVVVAHSYGATVVGLAASNGDGLAVNDIIVAGGPGMRVPDATHLNINPQNVWAGSSRDDIVTGLGPVVHDTAPHTQDFGANRFRVDTEGHVDYWRPGTESLRNQALILIGEYGRVTLEHGTPPR